MASDDHSLDATLASTDGALGEGAPTIADHGGESLVDARLPEERIGRYLVLDHLGSGGMGTVYAAYDPELDRKVAIKLLRDASGTTEGQARLIREAQAMAKLSHPNVVAVHDVGTSDRRVYVAMEFVEGQTLSDCLEQERPGWRAALDLVMAAGRGLAAAHAKGLIHRDFKPDNVMVGTDGQVKVMDFGLARAADEDLAATSLVELSPVQDALHTDLTRTGALMGTPRYMAPEQFARQPTDARTDQFALCVTMWQAVYGQRPFRGDTMAALMFQVRKGEVREPPRGNSVPGWVRRTLERGLATTPAERWPDVDTLLETLDRDPTLRRRRIVAAVGLLGVVAGLVGGARVQDTRARAACTHEARATLEPTWNAARREALQSTIGGQELGFAEAVAVRLPPRLDDWASGWIQVHERTCLAETVEATLAPEEASTIRDCLEDRRAAAERLLSRLEDDPAGEELANAIEAVAGLPSPLDCEHPRRRAARHGTDDDPRIARAQLEETLGRHAQAVAIIEPVTREAASANARALLVEGRARAGVGDQLDALDVLERAYLQAVRDNETETASDALLERTRLLVRLSRKDEARLWLDMTKATLVARNDLEGLRHSDWLLLDATLARKASDFTASGAGLEAALELRTVVLGPDHPDLAPVLHELGTHHEQAGDPSAASEAHQRGLDLRRELLGERHPLVGSSLLMLGAAQLAGGDHPAAAASMREGMTLLREGLGSAHPAVAHGWSQLARVELAMGNAESAEEHIETAVKLLESQYGTDNLRVAELRLNLGAIRINRGKFPEARDALESALVTLRKAWGDDSNDVALALGNLGTVDAMEDDYDGALERWRETIAVTERVHGPDHPDLVDWYQNVGAIQRMKGQLEPAARSYERAIAIAEKTLGPEHPTLVAPLGGYAQVLLDQDKTEAAAVPARRAAAIARSKLAPGHIERVDAECKLGSVMILEQDYAGAIAIYEAVAPHLDGDEHVFVAPDCMSDHAEALWLEGDDRERSRELMQKALDRYRATENVEGAEAVEDWLKKRR